MLSATVAELARVGYVELRVEDIAARAGVNKTTVYRRWPTKAELVSAALRAVVGQGEPVPETGSARRDLLELVHRALAFLRTPEGRAIARLVTMERADPDVDRIARGLRDDLLAARRRVVERAQERGELAREIDPRLVIDAIFAPVMSSVVRFNETLDDAMIEKLVDLVVSGAERVGAHRR